MAAAMSSDQVRIWINACNSETARETLRELLAYRVGGHAAPLKQRALEAVVTKMLDWASKRCPCTNEQPNPCPLCMADANKPGDACKAVDETFPPILVRDMRLALAVRDHPTARMTAETIDPAAIRHHALRVLHHITVAEGIRQSGADPAGEMAEAKRHLIDLANQFGMFCDPIDDEARGHVEGRAAAE